MIKCDVKVCGTVSRAAEMRTNKNGESYMAFAMSVTIPAKNGNGKLIDISVSSNGDEIWQVLSLEKELKYQVC